MKNVTTFQKINSHAYSFRVTVANRLYIVFYVSILKLKLQQSINTNELAINLITGPHNGLLTTPFKEHTTISLVCRWAPNKPFRVLEMVDGGDK
jgi:hypothetical protein